METLSKDQAKLVIRMPQELHRALHAMAAEHERSLNGEIVYALKRYAAEAQDERLLRAAIARMDRGETLPLPRSALATLRQELDRGTPARVALERAGLLETLDAAGGESRGARSPVPRRPALLGRNR
ncbi:MAG: toxin-antitoxin system HicB family antitoxin [Chloroflexi bacterium]|nr:toxin-antitoxin system HicB family antitoxin [Chloroflexota bacterium]